MLEHIYFLPDWIEVCVVSTTEFIKEADGSDTLRFLQRLLVAAILAVVMVELDLCGELAGVKVVLRAPGGVIAPVPAGVVEQEPEKTKETTHFSTQTKQSQTQPP